MNTEFSSPSQLINHYRTLRNKLTPPPRPLVPFERTRLSQVEVVAPVVIEISEPVEEPVVEVERDEMGNTPPVSSLINLIKTKQIPASEANCRRLIALMAEQDGLHYKDIIADDRRGHVKYIRFKLYFIFTQIFGFSMPKTGMFLKRDHTSVLHGARQYKKWNNIP